MNSGKVSFVYAGNKTSVLESGTQAGIKAWGVSAQYLWTTDSQSTNAESQASGALQVTSITGIEQQQQQN